MDSNGPNANGNLLGYQLARQRLHANKRAGVICVHAESVQIHTAACAHQLTMQPFELRRSTKGMNNLHHLSKSWSEIIM
jgi:hypothetical protein